MPAETAVDRNSGDSGNNRSTEVPQHCSTGNEQQTRVTTMHYNY